MSTFAAPASATTGLQNYDLEGARARRKKRRSKTSGIIQEKPMTTAASSEALKLFIPITKVDAAKRLVYGLATAEIEDQSGEICDYASTKPLYEKWSGEFEKNTDGKSLGNLRSMHGNIAAGKLTALNFDDAAKRIEICAKVVDDAEWGKVEEGVYTGFSQGGSYVKRWKDEAGKQRYTANPVEVSLVDAPCLKDATFSVIKADGTTEMRKFKTVEAPSSSDIAAKAIELAKAAGDESKWADHIAAAAAVLATPAPVAKGDAPNDNEVGEQVWVNDRLPGKTFKKKADLRQALLDLDASAAAAKVAAPVLDALSAVKDQLTKHAGGDAGKAPVEVLAGDGVVKKDYSDDEHKDMADKGEAMKDGSFPIKNKDDLENAVKAYGRSKSKTAAKRHITKRAKALGATDLLPADWKGSTKDKDASKIAGDGALAKGADLWSISDLLLLLDGVSRMEDNAELPSWSFGNSVDLPKDLCDRFGAALIELGDIAAEMLDTVLSAMKEEEDAEAANEVAASVSTGDMLKAVITSALIKAGAKHAKADKDKIKQAHDLLVDLDPDCCDAEDDDDEDAEKVIKTLTAERDADRKAFGETLDGITKTLADITPIVKAIAEQPLPMGTSSVLRVAEKSRDFGRAADDLGAAATSEDPLERLASKGVRLAQQMPVR